MQLMIWPKPNRSILWADLVEDYVKQKQNCLKTKLPFYRLYFHLASTDKDKPGLYKLFPLWSNVEPETTNWINWPNVEINPKTSCFFIMITISVKYICANGRSSSSLKVLQIKNFSKSIGQTLNIQPPKTAATLPISFPIQIAMAWSIEH